MKTAVVGGGAAGFFLAINLAELCPAMEVTIFERGSRVLRKVAVSGGGRCNCTNTFAATASAGSRQAGGGASGWQRGQSLQSVYPRGHRLLERLFLQFSPSDAYQWFESHGVPLTVQPDGCVFPRSQSSQTIIDMFLAEARRLGIGIRTNAPVNSPGELAGYDFIAITTGGMKESAALNGYVNIVPPVPSLFTFSINDQRLTSLMGTVVDGVEVMIPGTKLRAAGPLLITHWGMSGPCILRLSSYAARVLSEHRYTMPLSVNWLGGWREGDVLDCLRDAMTRHRQKLLSTVGPLFGTEKGGVPQRLWCYLLEKALGSRAHAPWDSLNRKELNRLVNQLVNDQYTIAGRAPFKDEFVTCGGVDLASVKPATLECRQRPRLFFAGEVLDIDGVTGGFNFQAAWTTAYTVAKAIASMAD